MGVIIYLEDYRQARAIPPVPAFSNFWFEVSIAGLNSWLQACIGYLPRSGQVIPFPQAAA